MSAEKIYRFKTVLPLPGTFEDVHSMDIFVSPERLQRPSDSL